MVSGLSKNVGFNPLISGSTRYTQLDSNALDKSNEIIKMLPEVQQKELLLLLQQLLKDVDPGSINAEMLLKIIEQYQDGIEGGTGLFIDKKV